jgi:hypothetical protein
MCWPGIGSSTVRAAETTPNVASPGGAWQAPTSPARGAVGEGRGRGSRLGGGRVGVSGGLPGTGCRSTHRWRMATTEGGCHCTSWFKTHSGGGCANASQSGTASTGGPPAGGDDPQRLGRVDDMVETPRYRGSLGSQGDDAHVGAAAGAAAAGRAKSISRQHRGRWVDRVFPFAPKARRAGYCRLLTSPQRTLGRWARLTALGR